MFPRDIDQKSHSRLLLINDHSLYTHMEALGRGMRSRSNRQETLKIGRAPGIRNWHNDLLGRDLGVSLAIDGCSVDPIDVFGGDLSEFVSVHICGPRSFESGSMEDSGLRGYIPYLRLWRKL